MEPLNHTGAPNWGDTSMDTQPWERGFFTEQMLIEVERKHN